MKLGVINSFLIVCFYNGFKSYQVGKYLQNSCKILHNGYKSTFLEYCVKSIINARENLPIIFRAIRSTKHLVDQVLADYIDYYMQGSSKSDKHGFSLLPA